jgi:hypothetical protein
MAGSDRRDAFLGDPEERGAALTGFVQLIRENTALIRFGEHARQSADQYISFDIYVRAARAEDRIR